MSDSISRLNAALQGRYRVERQVGEGGMATVYLADDLKHERRVALKVLEPQLAVAVGAERFLAEIKTTARLQHPHILPLFDSGEADGLLFYVMPFVEGESLRDRLDRERQLPVDEAVAIAKKVAGALQAAHDLGVIHRDIKPANILLAKGEPLVADFGIALAVSAAGGGRLTETGVSLGTPHYMSPEQATGDQALGPAADIYALGCVLYELLVGDPPFTGSTPQAVLGKIVAGAATPIRAQRKAVPVHVEAAVARALEKTAADRFASARQLSDALANTGFRWPPESFTRAGRSRSVATAAAFGVLGVIALWGWLRPAASTDTDRDALVSRSTITLPPGRALHLAGGEAYPIAISPDGRRIAYVGIEGSETGLFVRDLDDPSATRLPGTDDARQPFFSPDGERIAFFAGTELRVISVSGGIATSVADIPSVAPGAVPTGASETINRWYGGAWAPDGTILFSAGTSLWRTSGDGGSGPTEVALTMEPADGLPGTEAESAIPRPIKFPRFLPGGRYALVSVGWQDQVGVTGVVDLKSGRFRPLLVGGEPHHLPTGHLAIATADGDMSVVPIDLDRLEVTGSPRTVLGEVARGPAGSALAFTVSETGTLAYVQGDFERSLVQVDRSGRAEILGVEPRGYRFPDVSPDGRTVAVTVDPRPSQIWTVDLERGTASPLTTGPHTVGASFSADGSRLVFGFGAGVLIQWTPWPPEGPIQHGRAGYSEADWVGNDALVFRGLGPTGGEDLMRADLATGDTTVLVAWPSVELSPVVSRDQRWVAFSSDRTGVTEVYVTDVTGFGTPVQVSRGGGVEPRWSAAGDELFYRAGDWIVSVPLRTGRTVEVTGRPDSLFTGPYLFGQYDNWDVLPDGRFLMVRGDPSFGRQIEVVVNWFEDLR